MRVCLVFGSVGHSTRALRNLHAARTPICPTLRHHCALPCATATSPAPTYIKTALGLLFHCSGCTGSEVADPTTNHSAIVGPIQASGQMRIAWIATSWRQAPTLSKTPSRHSEMCLNEMSKPSAMFHWSKFALQVREPCTKDQVFGLGHEAQVNKHLCATLDLLGLDVFGR